MSTIDDVLASLDYSKPLEGLEDESSPFPLSFPKKPIAGAAITVIFSEVQNVLIPLYYAIYNPRLAGTRGVIENLDKRILEGAAYTIPGFIFGAAVSHNKKVREGSKRTERAFLERAYNALFEHPELVGIPASLLFYFNFNTYKMLDLPPENIITGIAYAGDIFRSFLAGMFAYCVTTLAAGMVHADSLRVIRDASLSRIFQVMGKYEASIKHQKRLTELPSLFSVRNHNRLGDLYLSNGLVLEAIDEYATGLKGKNQSESIPSDVFGFLGIFSCSEEVQSEDFFVERIRQGTRAFKNRKYRLADTRFREAIMIDPENKLSHIVYSHFLYGVGKDSEGDREQEIANLILFSSTEFQNDLTLVGDRTRNKVYFESVRL